jgi:hypothetical protein
MPTPRATLNAKDAVAIYLAKGKHCERDGIAAILACRYGITPKAVRDIWTLRTWAKATMPYMSREDLVLLHHKHCTKRAKSNQFFAPFPAMTTVVKTDKEVKVKVEDPWRQEPVTETELPAQMMALVTPFVCGATPFTKGGVTSHERRDFAKEPVLEGEVRASTTRCTNMYKRRGAGHKISKDSQETCIHVLSLCSPAFPLLLPFTNITKNSFPLHSHLPGNERAGGKGCLRIGARQGDPMSSIG